MLTTSDWSRSRNISVLSNKNCEERGQGSHAQTCCGVQYTHISSTSLPACIITQKPLRSAVIPPPPSSAGLQCSALPPQRFTSFHYTEINAPSPHLAPPDLNNMWSCQLLTQPWKNLRPVGGLGGSERRNAACELIKLQSAHCQRWALELVQWDGAWEEDTCTCWSTCETLWHAIRCTALGEHFSLTLWLCAQPLHFVPTHGTVNGITECPGDDGSHGCILFLAVRKDANNQCTVSKIE